MPLTASRSCSTSFDASIFLAFSLFASLLLLTGMHSRHVPSPSLLRYLARKTLEATEFRQAVHTTRRQCRKFSCSNRRPAVPSARASQHAREGARQWASTRWSDKDPKRSLAPFRDVLNSEFVRQDFREQLGLVNSFNISPAPDRVATLVLGAMKENNSPARLADYCIGTGKVTDSYGDYAGGLSKYYNLMR